MGWVGIRLSWDGNLCGGLFYEHRFVVLIIIRNGLLDGDGDDDHTVHGSHEG